MRNPLSTVILVSILSVCAVAAEKKPKEPPAPPPPVEKTESVGKGGYLVQAKDKLPKTIYVTENVTGPIPTNDWWTSMLWEPYSSNTFAHPLAFKAEKTGMRTGYPGPELNANEKGFNTPFKDGEFVIGHSASEMFPDARVDAYSDWFVKVRFKDGDKTLWTTFGHGSPFVYVRTAGGNPVIKFNMSPEVWAGGEGKPTIAVTIKGKAYALFGPPNSKWKVSGATFENDQAGAERFISLAVLPAKNNESLELFQKYAMNEVVDTTVTWKYDPASAQVETTYAFKTTPFAPGGTAGTVFALYPHQWMNADAKSLLPQEYISVRGPMKMGVGMQFVTKMTFPGVLPLIPAKPNRDAAVIQKLKDLMKEGREKPFNDPADSYWTAKPMDDISLMLPIAEQLGDAATAKELLGQLKSRLENWFTPPGSKHDHYFTYNKQWGTLMGQNTSYGSEALNDHHFHYGYFVRVAAEIARLDPEWAKDENWGGMVKMLIRDFASANRKDALFPWMRSFDLYAGHSWAGGSAINPNGNNQESHSEAMNAWTGVFLFGMATGDNELRDLGAYLYTTEMAAGDCYWFDVEGKLFPKGYGRSCGVLVFGGSTGYGTWFSGKPEHCHGIILLPLQPGSLYLGRHPEYIKRNLENLVSVAKTEALDWMEFFAPYQALVDPVKGLQWYESMAAKMPPPHRPIAYQWITSMQTLGRVEPTVTSDAPCSLTFNNNGKKNYVVYNYTDKPYTATFSDGVKVEAKTKGLTFFEK